MRKEREKPDDRGPDGAIQPGTGITRDGRREIVLGYEFDGVRKTLPPYVELEGGIQVHPDRLKDYLDRHPNLRKKNKRPELE